MRMKWLVYLRFFSTHTSTSYPSGSVKNKYGLGREYMPSRLWDKIFFIFHMKTM